MTDIPASVKNTAMLQMAITIDDLPFAGGRELYDGDQLASMLARVCKDTHVPITGFVNSSKFKSEEACRLFSELWSEGGLLLGNHTACHTSLHSCSPIIWEEDVIRGEIGLPVSTSLTKDDFKPFRYPYLDMGITPEQRERAVTFLRSRGYSACPVSVDVMDWLWTKLYESQAFVTMEPRESLVERFLQYVRAAVQESERLFLSTIGRIPAQVVLLHANWLTADVFPQIIAEIAKLNYAFITVKEALTDEAYSLPTSYFGKVGTIWPNHLRVTQGELSDTEITPVIAGWDTYSLVLHASTRELSFRVPYKVR